MSTPRVRDTLVLLSGGLDSTVLAYLFRDSIGLAVFARYGQRHFMREWAASRAIAAKLGVQLVEIDLTGVYANVIEAYDGRGNLLLAPSSTAAARGAQATPAKLVGTATVVPNRNMILLAAAGAAAAARGLSIVAYGATASDHAFYPDCRAPFIHYMQQVMEIATEPGLKLIAPFEKLSKREVVLLGSTLSVPFDLTWSCYAGRSQQCGVCGACVERRRAFTEADVEDPTPYAPEGA